MKIVYNTCYGGFGLSDAAIIRYAEIAGITLYPEKVSSYTMWYKVSVDERKTINDEDLIWDSIVLNESDIERTDPILVQVVEELGEKANGEYAKLNIVDLEPGTRYRIDEYDGSESVATMDDYHWSVAT